MAHFFVAIAYNKGVVSCKQYNGTLTGEGLLSLSGPIFYELLKEVKILMENFLQDGDPGQVPRCPKNAMDDVGCRMFAIPARLPDLNPIENMFHLVLTNLQKDGLTKEIKKKLLEFSRRVQNTI